MAVFNFSLTAKTDVKIKLSYFGNPNPIIATYIYRLKAKNTNTPLLEFFGDNQNGADDLYALTTPLTDNKGCYILLSNEIAPFNGDSKYIIQTEIIQDGKTTDTFEDKGEIKAGDPSHAKIILINII